MGNFNSSEYSREDAVKTYESHMRTYNQGYFKNMQKFANTMLPLVGGSDSPFSKEGWDKILKSDALWEKSLALSAEMFSGNKTLQNRYVKLMNNTRDIANSVDRQAFGIEGWGGGTAVYASSQGAFAMGATPFIIGGWLASCRSEEIFQHIDDKNSFRLEFEYNIDYLMIGRRKMFFPEAYRSGEMEGFNKLPRVDWMTPNTKNGTFTAPADAAWCGEDYFILLETNPSGTFNGAKGNLLEACHRDVMKYGIEPNCRITAVKYEALDDAGTTKTFVKKLNLHYGVHTSRTNERLFESQFYIRNLKVSSTKTVDAAKVVIKMNVNLDTSDFALAVVCDDKDVMSAIKGLQLYARVSNEANEMTDIPTKGTDKYQFIRECEYRNYAKVSLNEYMADNFRIGSNNNISYAAYATDKVLQDVVGNRELEAESFLINDVLGEDVDLDSFELTNKCGGYINDGLSFEISRMAPGLSLQDYKDGLKSYIIDNLAIAETDIHIPASVKREWILLGYDVLVSKFPEIRYENAIVNLNEKPEGTQVNENYGFAVDTKCGFVDSLGRSVRIISNIDSRWRDRAPFIYGALRTYSMEYPFLVYYPHAIRMFTAIDADMPNRTAIYVGGREYRGVFAAGAIQLALNGVLDNDKKITNVFDRQVADAKSDYYVTNTPVTSGTQAGS